MASQNHPYYQENLETILAEFKPYMTAMQQAAPKLMAQERLPKDDEIRARQKSCAEEFEE